MEYILYVSVSLSRMGYDLDEFYAKVKNGEPHSMAGKRTWQLDVFLDDRWFYLVVKIWRNADDRRLYGPTKIWDVSLKFFAFQSRK